jgi:hypothetical protein
VGYELTVKLVSEHGSYSFRVMVHLYDYYWMNHAELYRKERRKKCNNYKIKKEILNQKEEGTLCRWETGKLD